MSLVFASNNAKKLHEIRHKINDEILSLNDINCFDEIEETGTTFKENALIKAQFIYDKYHLDCFADDSGLVVESLNGEPGVYSARYAGEQKNDADNNYKLLEKMKNISDRRAKFITVICLIKKGVITFFTGEIHGTIAHEKIGGEGFGYDPIFIPNGFTKTFAQLSLQEKSTISHRALAVEKMIAYLKL